MKLHMVIMGMKWMELPSFPTGRASQIRDHEPKNCQQKKDQGGPEVSSAANGDPDICQMR